MSLLWLEQSLFAASVLFTDAGSDIAIEEDMSISEVFVLMLVAMSIGWVAVAAVRSNRRNGALSIRVSPDAPTDVDDERAGEPNVDRAMPN
jgi:hypothetical protein